LTKTQLVLAIVLTAIASSSTTIVATHVATSVRRSDALETRSLTIIDSKNQPIAVLSSLKDSPAFALLDQQQRRRAALFLESNGTPDLYLYDAAGKTRAALNLYDSGVPNLAFLDASGGADGPNLVLEETSEGRFRLAFHDFRTKTVVGTLEFDLRGGAPSLELMDSSGRNVWSASAPGRK